MKLTRAVAVVALLLVGAACGGGDSKPASPTDVAKTLDCDHFSKKDTEEMYVRTLYSCDSTSVYFFNDNAARDNWRKVAEKLGSVVLDSGDRWVQTKA